MLESDALLGLDALLGFHFILALTPKKSGFVLFQIRYASHSRNNGHFRADYRRSYRHMHMKVWAKKAFPETRQYKSEQIWVPGENGIESGSITAA